MQIALRASTWLVAAAASLLAAVPAFAGPADATPQTQAAAWRPADIVDVSAIRVAPRKTRTALRRRFEVELELGPVWQSRNDVAVPGRGGTRFAVDGTTGAGPFAYGRITVDYRISRRHKIRALIAPLQLRRTGTLDRPVSFRGQTFAAGIATRATFKFNSYRLGYRYLLASGRRWDLHVGATAKIRDAEIELRQAGLVVRKSDIGFVPLLHVDFEWRLRPGWRFTADLDGLAAPQGRAFDLALKLHRDVSARWSVAVGYRMIEGGADNDSVYTFSWFHQALVSISYRF